MGIGGSIPVYLVITFVPYLAIFFFQFFLICVKHVRSLCGKLKTRRLFVLMGIRMKRLMGIHRLQTVKRVFTYT